MVLPKIEEEIKPRYTIETGIKFINIFLSNKWLEKIETKIRPKAHITLKIWALERSTIFSGMFIEKDVKIIKIKESRILNLSKKSK